MYFISVFKCYFLIPHHWSLPAVLTVPDFPSYFTLVLGSQGSCGEIGLPHWVWCRKQDFQVVAPRSLTWQDRLSPPWEIPPLTLPSGPQAGCCPLQVLHPAVSQPAACRGWRWKWMKFPDAPPVFGLLTLQLHSECGRLSPRFTVDCVGLTSGRPAVTCSHLDTLESLLFHFTTCNNLSLVLRITPFISWLFFQSISYCGVPVLSDFHLWTRMLVNPSFPHFLTLRYFTWLFTFPATLYFHSVTFWG